jgi:pimeloyl-ACP methyl ester carboxylesterase
VGAGPAVVILPGYAMQPWTYLPPARLLADDARVVIPAVFSVSGRWSFRRALGALEATLDELGFDRVSLIGHSFSGGLELGLAARQPQRIVECVFSDTLAVRTRFRLAEEALRHPLGILSMATPPAVVAFAESWATHPAQLIEAALWGFISDRQDDIDAVVAAGIPCHVLWANHDSLLARSDGQEFAHDLHASFTVASGHQPSERIDHDWMFDDPELFVEHLRKLDLRFLGGADGGARHRAPAGTGPPDAP